MKIGHLYGDRWREPLPPIPFGEIIRENPLEEVLKDDGLTPERNGMLRCPFHAGGRERTPSMRVREGRYRCFACGASGNVIDYVMARDGSKLLDALKTLGWRSQAGGVIRRKRRSPSRPRPPQPPPRTDKAAWHDPAWQAALNAIIEEAEARLWSPDGRDALDWLRNRGLEDHTLSRFRVGFIDRPIRTRPLDVLGLDKHGRKRGLWLPRGVVLPWVAPGAWYPAHQDPDEPAPEARWCGLNVRRLHHDVSQPWDKDTDGPKLMAAAGSERGHAYPWPDLCAGVPALICEGELDALLAFQEVGHLVNVVSVGSASQTPSQAALRGLACCPRWIVVLDSDEAGRLGAWKWFEIGPSKVQPIRLEEGADLTDHYLTGKSVVRLIARTGSA